MWSAPFPPVYDSEMLPATVVVSLTKPTSSAPVGLNLVNGSDAISPPVLGEEVRGLALACGLLQLGDLLLSVNEVEVTDQAALGRAANAMNPSPKVTDGTHQKKDLEPETMTRIRETWTRDVTLTTGLRDYKALIEVLRSEGLPDKSPSDVSA